MDGNTILQRVSTPINRGRAVADYKALEISCIPDCSMRQDRLGSQETFYTAQNPADSAVYAELSSWKSLDRKAGFEQSVVTGDPNGSQKAQPFASVNGCVSSETPEVEVFLELSTRNPDPTTNHNEPGRVPPKGTPEFRSKIPVGSKRQSFGGYSSKTPWAPKKLRLSANPDLCPLSDSQVVHDRVDHEITNPRQRRSFDITVEAVEGLRDSGRKSSTKDLKGSDPECNGVMTDFLEDSDFPFMTVEYFLRGSSQQPRYSMKFAASG